MAIVLIVGQHTVLDTALNTITTSSIYSSYLPPLPSIYIYSYT